MNLWPSSPNSRRMRHAWRPWRASSAMMRDSIQRSSSVGAWSSHGRCCWMEANSVSAWTTMSLTTSLRMSGGNSSAVSYFRTPCAVPHRISRTGSIVPPSFRLFATGAALHRSGNRHRGTVGTEGAQRPLKLGFRFSTNAASPSFASSVTNRRFCSSRSSARPAVSGISIPSTTERLIRLTARAGPWARAAA